MCKKEGYPEARFEIKGFSEDPDIRMKEIEELKEKAEKEYEAYKSIKAKYEETKAKLKQFEESCKERNIQLQLKNNPQMKYYEIEDGNIFKRDIVRGLFYRLDLKQFKWNEDATLLSLYRGSHLKFQEILDFKDYFEDLELDRD